MFVREGARVRIIDLIRGIVVQSGNDACIVVAEGLAGSEAAFAQQMTERARELGLEDSTFTIVHLRKSKRF
jgi:D-alanyl-D-alanine carboxypeptidase (penicillin-binding protein 5/6)